MQHPASRSCSFPLADLAIMDALSDILHHVRLTGSLFCRAELARPWAVSTTGADGAIFHVIVSGSGYWGGERPTNSAVPVMPVTTRSTSPTLVMVTVW